MRIDAGEVKVLIVSGFGSIMLNVDILIKFFIPILSAAAWFYLKPVLEALKEKRRLKKLNKK